MSKIDLKVKITKEEFEQIQQKMLSNGVYWDFSGNIEQDYHESFKFLYYRAKSNTLQYGIYEHNFEIDGAKEVNSSDFISRIIQ